jgi:hypothetical protein
VAVDEGRGEEQVIAEAREGEEVNVWEVEKGEFCE